ncbi:MAG: lipoprotein NlpI [Idiomarina sp.]|nr:lipoprotein NlpI [Idiomarina sp.]
MSIRWSVLVFPLVLLGCEATPQRGDMADRTPVSAERTAAADRSNTELALIEPLPPSQARQAEVAQLTELLQNGELSRDQRAVVHYRRGVLYDALGLPTLALVDMNQALEIQPALADGWHYMGVYYTQHGFYSSAYESFDSTIELAPDHDYVYLNRGIASYYDGQYEFALNDLADFYFQDPSDPFRVAWYYFAAYEVDAERAARQLREQMRAVPEGQWGKAILQLLAGEIVEQELMERAFAGIDSHAELIDRLCEAYFYMGKRAVQQGRIEVAMNYFKLALMTNKHDFLEHRFARTELYRLRENDSDAEFSSAE